MSTPKIERAIAADDERKPYYVIWHSISNQYWSYGDFWSAYAAAMQYPTSNAAQFERKNIEGPHIQVVGPCIEGEEP